jgi:hypothetical protein
LKFLPHRQVVFAIPKMLRIFFKYNRRLLGELCRCALRSLTRYFEVLTGSELMPGVIAAIQTFGARINFHPHLHFLVTEGGVERLSLDEREAQVGYRYSKEAKDLERMDYLEFIARVTSHIPDKGQVTVRYYGLYANAHRGMIKKASLSSFPLRIGEDKLRRLPAKGWAEMIRKVYEVDPMLCPRCGGKMKVVAFITDFAVVDKIIDHLKLSFIADRPPPSHIAYHEVLMAAEASTEYSP